MKHANVALFVPDAGCTHRCVFCNQTTISGEQRRIGAEDVRRAAETAIRSGVDPAQSEIAFFGGSFTAIDENYMTELLGAAKPYIDAGHFYGIRISTRPDAITREKLELLRSFGVTSIELGCQSMNNEVLRLCAREHTAGQTEQACKSIRAFGFSLGVQLMTGLPGDTDETCVQSAKQLIALQPDTVRIYPTLVLEHTPLAALWRKGDYRPQTLEEAVALCSRLLSLFHEQGVRVIRLGLHAGTELENGFLAGPMHPAFRELCEARLYRTKMEQALKELPKGAYQISVGPRYLSQAAGQKKENLRFFSKQGYDLTLAIQTQLKQYEIEIQGKELCI